MKNWTLLLGLILLSLQLTAQSNSGIPFIHNYSPTDYHQGTQNFAILKVSTGVLYVGNSNGVIEFDGNQFTLIPVSNRSEVHSLAMDSSGTIYVGGQGDFGFLKRDSLSGRMRYVSLISKLDKHYRNFNDVWSIHITPHEVIFRSTAGLYIYRDQKIKAIPLNSFSHRSFYVNGTLYLREENVGLRKLANDSLVLASEGEFFLNEGIYGMLPLSENKCLVLTGSKGFFTYDGTHFEKIRSSAADIVTGQINFCEKISNNQFAIGTRRSGLIIIDGAGNVVTRIDKTHGLLDNSIWYIFPDNDDLWLAENNGFSLVEFSSPFRLFGKLSGLDGHFFHTIKQGEYVYTAGASGVYYKKWEPSADPTSHAFHLIKDLDVQAWHFYQDSTTVLVATNRGIFELVNGQAKPIGFNGRSWYFLPLNNFPGHALVNTADGLLVLKRVNGKFVVHANFQNQVSNFYVFTQDDDGNIWADTPTKGIYRIQFNNGINSSPTVTLYNSKHGLPSDLKIRAFYSRSGVLFGSEKGIYRFDDKKDSFYPDKKLNIQLSVGSDFVEYMKESPWGDIAFTAKRTSEDYEELVRGIGTKKDDNSYGVNTDIFQKIKNFGISDFLFIDKENVLIATSDGIVHYNSVKESKTEFKAIVRKLELLKSDSTLFHGSAPDALEDDIPYSSNGLKFTVASSDLRSPASVQYQYFLEGSDKEWSPWTTVNVKEYTNLSEGTYTLKVRAKNQYHQLSTSSSFVFTIGTPWYRSIAAYIGYFVLIVFSAYLALVLYTKNLNNENIKLEKMIDERTLEIKSQHQNIVEQNRLLEIQKNEINTQNESIKKQNEALEKAQQIIAQQVEQLKAVNQGLEENVAERTKQLQDAYQDLLEIKNELDTFIYRSSHDINGPLMRLRGLCRTAALDVTDLTSLNYFRLLDLEVDVMARMLQKLIFFYNIKNSDPKAERIEILDLINKAIKRQESLPGFSQVEFEVNTSEDKIFITDNELLSAAVSNLVENAVMYRATEKTGTVTISTERKNGTLQITVSDNGLGIDKSIASQIFNMFFRGTQRSNGAGLGLYIAKEAIKKLKGEIQYIASTETTFTISVPVSA
jgi:signal transduction histidine kinase